MATVSYQTVDIAAGVRARHADVVGHGEVEEAGAVARLRDAPDLGGAGVASHGAANTVLCAATGSCMP